MSTCETSSSSTPCRSIISRIIFFPVTTPYPPYVQHVLSQHSPPSIYSILTISTSISTKNKTCNRYLHRSSRIIISQPRNPTRSLDSSQPGPISISISIPWLHFLHVLLSRPWSYWLWSSWCEAFPVAASWCGGVHFFLNVGDAGSHFKA
jgi:hypothetical protein